MFGRLRMIPVVCTVEQAVWYAFTIVFWKFLDMEQARVLILNAGSSTLKIALFEALDNRSSHFSEPLWFHNIPIDFSSLKPADIEKALRQELSKLVKESPLTLPKLEAVVSVGYRVVHGAGKYTKSTLVTDEVKADIESFSPLAPIHNPAALSIMIASEKIFPKAQHVVAFDTAFHHTLEPEAYLYAIPYKLYKEKNIRKFGFHGINHEYCARQAAEMLEGNPSDLKLIVCHLGNGCSLSAIKAGRSCDTTMGFTPLEGLVMGTRSGSIDPGILLHLLSNGEISPALLDHMLNHESGLKGLSGKSGDMRSIVDDMKNGDSQAEVAFKVFVHRLRAMVASMVASLGRLDALVFTAGIGENSPEVRKTVCDGLAFLGLEIDERRNLTCRADAVINTAGSRIKILVLKAGEEKAIAADCIRLMKSGYEHEKNDQR